MPSRRRLGQITGDDMKIREVLRKSIQVLMDSNIEAPAVEAGVILCHILGCDKAYIYTHGDRVLNPDVREEVFNKISERAAGVPVQYITGHQEFMSLDFKVIPDVLIPRHDTEILVETVIEHARMLNEQSVNYNGLSIANYQMPTDGKISTLNSQLSAEYALRILDIGTGSGCIAVSLAYYIPGCRVTAVDISGKALNVARLNAANAGVNEKIEFIESNLFEKVPKSAGQGELFDIIVSNPPYIPSGEIPDLQREVRENEPLSALDGGSDGLYFYREIIELSHNYLRKDGLLAFEVGYNQAEDVYNLMEGRFCSLAIEKDIAGINRVVKGRLI